ncbi:hypothetical protein QF035_000745 [Streptomyces umbrinus]|uniref:Tc1-like transposase DDE domain-containing protein n=1 Tax=Streptomyces umbrinus TaxID=67370 RepID=A0ABU0SHW3_9ACTN|nr:hypothetical protein [Streptomyces umbrinus]
MRSTQSRTTRPLRSTPITGASSLLRAGPPAGPASVLDPSRCPPLGALPLARRHAADSVGACLLLFHAEAADRAHVAYMPDTTWPINGHPPGSSRSPDHAPVSMSSVCLSTHQQRFTCVRLPGPHLTPLTTPFPHRSPRRSSTQRSMRRFEVSPRRATPKGHKSFIFRTAPFSEAVPTTNSLSCSGHKVWDNLNTHRAAGMRQYAADHDWLTICQLPSYAPDLNPVEGIWSLLRRGALANVAFTDPDPDHLTRTLRRALSQIQRRPDLIDGCLTENRTDHHPKSDANTKSFSTREPAAREGMTAAYKTQGPAGSGSDSRRPAAPMSRARPGARPSHAGRPEGRTSRALPTPSAPLFG